MPNATPAAITRGTSVNRLSGRYRRSYNVGNMLSTSLRLGRNPCNPALMRYYTKAPGMREFSVVVERDPATGLYVGHVPGWPGAHSQGTSPTELEANLREVVMMLLEDGEPKFESEFIGVQTLRVA
jgi:predicted RNase H-like HicB family nuclease